MNQESRYLLENSSAGAHSRLDLLARLFDPWTFAHFAEVGVEPGWRCWEVGAGGSSVVAGLSRLVGSEGFVLATDIDVAAIDVARLGNVKVQVHDVGLEPAPEGEFDLVHARLVLVHVANRARAIETMVDALAPGGVIVIEDADPGLQPLSVLHPTSEVDELANTLRSGFRELLRARGADLAFGRTLPGLLREAGLIEVRSDAFFPIVRPECARLELATLAMIAGQLIDAQLATLEQIDRLTEALRAGTVDVVQPPLISAWGRRSA